MTSKERVMAALDHREPDRIPLDVGGTNNSTMHYSVQKELQQYLKLKVTEPDIMTRMAGVVVPDDELVDYFGGDFCCIYLKEAHPWADNGDGTYTDMWGIQMKLNPDGLYYNMIGHPLEAAETVKELEKYQFPTPNGQMLEGLQKQIDLHPDKCLVLDGTREPMFGLPSWLRGNVNFYMDIVSDDGLAEALLDRILEYYLKLMDYVMGKIGSKIDVVKFADDMGTQNSLIMSPETYRRLIKPRQYKLYSYVKQKYGKKILLHSCGAVRDIIGDFIEIGVDALNPVQISAAGMDPQSLKKEFGDKITFWGGGVDTQKTLQFGTPEEVRNQVKQNIKCFKPGGGFIFTQVHNIVAGVPVENILAMYSAYREFCAY